MLSIFAFRHATASNLLEVLLSPHYPTQKRFALRLEMLLSSHYPTQNRFALLLEMLCIVALSDAKPLRTFAGTALYRRIVRREIAPHFCWNCSPVAHFTMEERFARAGDA